MRKIVLHGSDEAVPKASDLLSRPLFARNEHILQLSGTWSNHINVLIVLSSFHITDRMPDSTMRVLRVQSDTGNLSERMHHMSAIANVALKRIPLNLNAYITMYVKPRLSVSVK